MTDDQFHRAVANADGVPIALRTEALRRLRLAWQPSGVFTAGHAAESKALAIAWMILAGHQARVAPPNVADLGLCTRRPDRALTAALRRAAMHVDEPLASHLRSIGVRNGRPCVKGQPIGKLVCTL